MRAQPKPNLVKINPAKDNAQRVRATLAEASRRAWRDHGGNLAGFALVAWDRRGAPYVAVSTSLGPISSGMLAAYVSDALNRMEAVSTAQTSTVESLE